jgi:hypothetical protein
MPIHAKNITIPYDYITKLAALACLVALVCDDICRQLNTKVISMLKCIGRPIACINKIAGGRKREVTRHYSDKWIPVYGF